MWKYVSGVIITCQGSMEGSPVGFPVQSNRSNVWFLYMILILSDQSIKLKSLKIENGEWRINGPERGLWSKFSIIVWPS